MIRLATPAILHEHEVWCICGICIPPDSQDIPATRRDRYGHGVPDLILSPVQPYSLLASVRGSNPSRRVEDGVLHTVFEVAGTPVSVRVWQTPDGALAARFDGDAPEGAEEALRFLLAVDVDHNPFLAMAADDPLLAPLVSQRRGLRPMRAGTVTHALVQAFAGQLITAREARLIELRIARLVGRPFDGLVLPLTADDLRKASSAALVRCGLAPRRAAALARIVRALDLERLRTVPIDAAVARLERERTIGPWSSGLVALYGIGSLSHGLVGDLGLIRLAGNLQGRPATADDTRALLTRYDPWAGIAGCHLMRHPLAGQRLMYAA